jgi:ATP-dependent DNA ligase
MAFRVRTARRAAIQPCLPIPAKEPPSGRDWIHEIKHDGFRIIAMRDGDRVRLLTRRLITGGTEEWAALRAAWERYEGAPTQGGRSQPC